MKTEPELLATGLTDNALLDEWTIPFGNWIKQMVDWTDQNMDWLLKIIEWPFNLLIDNLVTNFLAQISWVWICLAVFIIGSLTRSLRIGMVTSMALAMCGLLGQQYWLETARTIGMILVAVVLCAIVGIPIGVASGRFDSIWNAVRPAMDAMQVVHPFVYMLPVVFFWGIGVVPATMVTMVFAIPPLIRLTNLGIRQVPEDVVEASRAYGAPEWRVLTDVQLPLALPAIMTGLNQTLLMAISMLGIAAIMGAGGLGLLVFRAVNNLNVALAASAGLALFLVAVVLDRISQREATDSGNLFSRIRRAWALRTAPELLLGDEGVTMPEEIDNSEGVPEALDSRERSGLLLSGVGAIIAAISVLLVWSKNTGLLSSYARAADETGLIGRSFNGVSATGGSWFGILVVVMAVWIFAAVVTSLAAPGRGPRWLGVDAVMFGALSLVALALGYLLTRVSPLPTMTTEYQDGPGPLLALGGAAIAAVGAVMVLSRAPFVPRRPLADQVAVGRVIAAVGALALITVGALSIWTEDRREREIMTPEVAAEIEALRAEAREDPALGALNAQKVSNLFNSARQSEVVALRGLAADGPGLGWPMLAIGLLGVGASLPAAGVFGRSEQRRWRWSVAMAAIGLAGMMIPIGWVTSLLRVSEPNFVSGAGAFLAGLGSFLLVATNKGVLELFRRSRSYGEGTPGEGAPGSVDSQQAIAEPATTRVAVTAGR